ALEDVERAVALVDIVDLDQRHQPPRVRRWSRSISRSTQRACGMVIRTNRKATVVTEDRLKWLLATILAWLKASMAPITLTRAVSFCSEMKSLSSGGMI